MVFYFNGLKICTNYLTCNKLVTKIDRQKSSKIGNVQEQLELAPKSLVVCTSVLQRKSQVHVAVTPFLRESFVCGITYFMVITGRVHNFVVQNQTTIY